MSELIQQFRPVLTIAYFLEAAAYGLLDKFLLLGVHFILEILLDNISATSPNILPHSLQRIALNLNPNQRPNKPNLTWQIR